MADKPKKEAAIQVLYEAHPSGEQGGMAYEVDEEGVINFMPFKKRSSKPEVHDERLHPNFTLIKKDMIAEPDEITKEQVQEYEKLMELHEGDEETWVPPPTELTPRQMRERYERMRNTSRAWQKHLMNNFEHMSREEIGAYTTQIRIYDDELSDMRQVLRIPVEDSYFDEIPQELRQPLESLEAVYNAMKKLETQKENK